MMKNEFLMKFIDDINTMLCLIKVNSNTIELNVHTSCDCVLDLLCVMQCSTIVTCGNDKSSIKRTF